MHYAIKKVVEVSVILIAKLAAKVASVLRTEVLFEIARVIIEKVEIVLAVRDSSRSSNTRKNNKQ